MQSEAVNMRVKVEQIPSGVQSHHGASSPIGREGIFYRVIPGKLCCGVEFSEKLPIELEVRSESLWDGKNLM